MKKTIQLATLALALTASLATAGGEGWMTDFEAAKKKAATEKKDLLVDFTGSDWCHWCIKLNDEVFKHDAFKKGVADKYILVELDYPRKPENVAKQDPAVKAQNEKLQETYTIAGFPTILLMDAKGRPYAQTGYEPEGPENYLKVLQELQKTKTARDAGFEAANKLQGVEKAKALVKVLSEISEDYTRNYPTIVTDIAKLDPEDTTGFTKKQKIEATKKKLNKELMTVMRSGKADQAPALIDKFIVDEKLKGKEKVEILKIKLQISISTANRSGKADTVPALIDTFITENKLEGADKEELLALKLQMEANDLMRNKKFAEVPAFIDAGITKYQLTGENKQNALGVKIGGYLQEQKFDEAAKVIDAIIAVDPTSELSKHAESFKPRLQKMKEAASKKPSKPNPAHGEPGHVHGK